jgi:alpha-acetolactate decarboxylase
MTYRFLKRFLIANAATFLFVNSVCHGQSPAASKPVAPATVGIRELVQYGKMHEVIGMQRHEGRVSLADLIQRPHFYGVGALAGLRGEISIIDGVPTVTEVIDPAHAKAVNADADQRQATMLIGAYVDSWTESVIDRDLNDSELDDWISSEIERLGGDVNQPTIFMVDGSFNTVHLHVINGACPVHARIRQLTIPEEQLPFDATLENVSGQVVGVFAIDAAGKLTHPATRTHKHLVYRDVITGERLNGHVESITVIRGARLLLPLR